MLLYLPALQSLQGSPPLPAPHDTVSLLHASMVPLPGRELGRVGNVFRHDLHVEFEVAPRASENVPAGHFSQSLIFSPLILFKYVPAGHGS